jgi:hypothetical protein
MMRDDPCDRRIVVYTAIFGHYDRLNEPECVNSGFDYVCFTDNEKLNAKHWKMIYLPSRPGDPAILNRKVKVLPHLFLPEYEYSIYIDGNVDITGNLQELISKYLGTQQIAFFSHPERNCIYEEAKILKELSSQGRYTRGNGDVIEKQMDKYKGFGYPVNNGLIAGGIILRRHNHPDIIRAMECWWEELNAHSKRDQLSFNYVAWQNSLEYAIIDGNLYGNSFFRVRGHNKSYFMRFRQWISAGGKYTRPFRPIVRAFRVIRVWRQKVGVKKRP